MEDGYISIHALHIVHGSVVIFYLFYAFTLEKFSLWNPFSKDLGHSSISSFYLGNQKLNDRVG